jgi:hypothetical protein
MNADLRVREGAVTFVRAVSVDEIYKLIQQPLLGRGSV